MRLCATPLHLPLCFPPWLNPQVVARELVLLGYSHVTPLKAGVAFRWGSKEGHCMKRV